MSILAGILISILAPSREGAEQKEFYVEIPIQGRFGNQVTAQGIEEALKAAQCAGANHIVFWIDSKGGDQLVALDIYNLLRKYDSFFKYHALVREATGVALAPIVWCDPIFIQPSGSIGGVNLVDLDTRYPGIETSVVLMNLALNAGEEAKRHGRSAELVRAMIDPGQAVYGWKDARGYPQISRWLPSDISFQDFIVQHEAGKVLTLSAHQAVELGFARAYSGDAAGLGCELGFCDWISKGDAACTAMAEATRAEQAKTLSPDERHLFLIEQNRRRMAATKASIERFLALANEWNPRLGTYSTYKETAVWWDAYWDGWAYDTRRLTPEARQRWRDRTDITVTALSKARAGVLEMAFLEKEARELGQPALYPPGKLEEMRLDLELKIGMLVREREKRFSDNR